MLNKVLRKGNEIKILYLALLLVLLHLHVLNIGFLSHYPFLKTLFPSFLHHLLPPIPISPQKNFFFTCI